MQGKPWRYWSGVVVSGLIVGLAATVWVLKKPDPLGVTVGPWKAHLLAGSAQADARTRARVAVDGILALGRHETLYYVAHNDSSGQPLRGQCTYRVSGLQPDARWWSITAYGADRFLIPGAEGHYSVNQHAMPSDNDLFVLQTAPVRPDTQFSTTTRASALLLTPDRQPFILALRLYNPSADLQRDPALLNAPRIELQGACK